MSDWEDLDATGRYFGVFATESYSPDPVAVFTREEDAWEWLSWQESRGDENSLAGCDYTVCIVERLAGRVWNSTDEIQPDKEPSHG